MRIPAAFPTIAATMLGAALLSSCTVVVDEPGPAPPRPGPAFCTREYAPVCGQRHGDRRTFANGCEADRAGFRIVHRGECRRDRPDRPRMCPRIYDPVCGRRHGDWRTFPNDCEAGQAGYRIVHGGRC